MTSLDLGSRVASLIARLGVDAVVTVVSVAGTGQPDGTVTGEESTTETVKATPPDQRKSEIVDGQRRESARTVISGSGLSAEPRPGWTITISGQTWRIVSVAPYADRTGTLCYELGLGTVTR